MHILNFQALTYVNKRSPTGDLVKRFMRLEWRAKFPACTDFGLN
jgi:hypothetical protein